MFKNICISNNGSTFPDLGLFAESLLFYNQVTLVQNSAVVADLIEKIGIDTIIHLITERNLRFTIYTDFLAVAENSSLGMVETSVNIVRPDWSFAEGIEKALFIKTKRKGYSRRISQRLADVAEPLTNDYSVAKSVIQDWSDHAYVTKYISTLLESLNPEIKIRPESIEYRIDKTPNGSVFHTNLNFDKINSFLPPERQCTNSQLLSNLIMPRNDLYMASKFDADLITNPTSQSLINLKFKSFQDKFSGNFQKKELFTEAVIPGFTIREAINSNEKTFPDFLELLEKSRRFKDWVEGIDDNENIVAQYIHDITHKTWAEKLPTKAFRFSIFAGIGAITGELSATLTGLAVGAADSFLLDKVISGWKPNSFINGPYKKFSGK